MDLWMRRGAVSCARDGWDPGLELRCIEVAATEERVDHWGWGREGEEDRIIRSVVGPFY
jgi:hypothetical protein